MNLKGLEIQIHRYNFQAMVLQNASHVGDVDAAHDDLATVGKINGLEPGVEGGADRKGYNSINFIGPELLQVRF